MSWFIGIAVAAISMASMTIFLLSSYRSGQAEACKQPPEVWWVPAFLVLVGSIAYFSHGLTHPAFWQAVLSGGVLCLGYVCYYAGRQQMSLLRR